jgi:2-polyprenyl-6-hydroxyphenyl methylase/3-demethylubiquinone-9 3-methyltransferase
MTDDRFAFGSNWARYLGALNEARITAAERSLTAMLGETALGGRRFLDVGSGSGLFSLAAMRLGAEHVHSFDADPGCVACTEELKCRYAPQAPQWTIERASILDAEHIASVGAYDVVYAWGVVHHTGALHAALVNATVPVAPGGSLFVSVYNEQGLRSRIWRAVKRGYRRVPERLRPAYVVAAMAPQELRALVQPRAYVASWTDRDRGMSHWHDMVDWVGGYPFEVARPEQVLDLCRQQGMTLERLRTVGGGSGCNEFVFRRA